MLRGHGGDKVVGKFLLEGPSARGSVGPRIALLLCCKYKFLSGLAQHVAGRDALLNRAQQAATREAVAVAAF